MDFTVTEGEINKLIAHQVALKNATLSGRYGRTKISDVHLPLDQRPIKALVYLSAFFYGFSQYYSFRYAKVNNLPEAKKRAFQQKVYQAGAGACHLAATILYPQGMAYTTKVNGRTVWASKPSISTGVNAENTMREALMAASEEILELLLRDTLYTRVIRPIFLTAVKLLGIYFPISVMPEVLENGYRIGRVFSEEWLAAIPPEGKNSGDKISLTPNIIPNTVNITCKAFPKAATLIANKEELNQGRVYRVNNKLFCVTAKKLILTTPTPNGVVAL